jgi:pimeloyl-ACP methyl ester carboxylesterase
VEKTILYQNKKIFYRSIGSGDPVMLVHGFGEDGNVWDKQVEHLKTNYHLIVPDLPGSGKSEMINDMSMEGMAEVLHTIIHEEMPPQTPPKEGLAATQSRHDENSLQKINSKSSASSKVPPSGGFRGAGCTVIGHSMGGYITLALVESYWNHVNAFGLFHSSAFPDTEEKKETRKKGIEFIKQHGAFEFLKTSTPNLFSPNSKLQIPNSIDKFIDSLKGFTPQALIAYYNAMMDRPDRTSILKNTKNPVLFIAGEHDNAIPLNDVLKQCHLPEKSYFHVLKKSGHMGMMEETENANRILEEFLLEK